MPTPAERKALFFLSGLMLLGSGVRASAALSGAERDPGAAAGQPALERQIEAVDTARARSASKKGSSKRKTKKGSSGRASAPSGGGAASGRDASGRDPSGGALGGVSLLSSRMGVSSSGGEVEPSIYYTATKPGKVDMDVADAAALEGLPRIGPVMAQRIVANRDSLGPFGSLKELQRVKGVGPALARTLSPYVTFSLRPRPSRVKEPARRPARANARRRPPSHQ